MGQGGHDALRLRPGDRPPCASWACTCSWTSSPPYFRTRSAAPRAWRAGATSSPSALGGSKMVAARAGRRGCSCVWGGRPRLIAVTVLTSMDDAALAGGRGPHAGRGGPRAASMVKANGADGIVCSPRGGSHARALSEVIVTPGVRPAGAALGIVPRGNACSCRCGRRLMLVIGRPITEADDRWPPSRPSWTEA